MIFDFSINSLILILSLYLSGDISITSRCMGKILDNVTSEEVKVSFVTRVRNKRNIHRNEFHILQVQRPAHNSSFHIHLAKNDRLISPDLRVVHRGNTTPEMAIEATSLANEGDCFYSGVINSDYLRGHAALSACGENPGFHGILLVDSKMYILEPQKALIDNDSVNSEMTHSLTAMSSDVISGVPKCGKSNPEAPPGIPYLSNELNENLGAAPLSAKRHITDSGKHLKRGKFFFESKSKSSFSTSTERIVELAIFADESYLEIIKKKLDTKSTKVIRGFICVLVEAMALLYQDESIKTKIGFKIVHIELFSKTPSSIVTHHGLLTPYLKSFCKYATDHTEPDSWDHAMLLTNTDLRDENSNNPIVTTMLIIISKSMLPKMSSFASCCGALTARLYCIGAAFTGGCCMAYGGCSIIESTTLQAAFVMAHEVGHSLGMGHDGENNNINCKKREHLMSPLLGPGQIKWSDCSNKNLEDFLIANEKSRFVNVRRGCLNSLTGTPGKSYQFMTDILPGERFTLNQQCYIFDTKRPVAVTQDMQSRFGLQGDICGQLYCTDSHKMFAIHAHPPLEGTVCASGKQCRNGECKTKS